MLSSRNNFLSDMLMESPWQLVAVITTYLLLKKYGTLLMKTRQGFNLKKIILIYNFLQILINIKMFFLGLEILPNVSFLCTTETYQIDKLHYYYTLSKYFDLLDTGFFILRKKTRHVSFLHVYHHTTILIYSWITYKYIPGGHAYFLFLFNSFVHVVMYLFYFVSCWDSSLVQNWWKKCVTLVQITQHITLFCIFLVNVLNPYCGYSKIASFAALYNLGVMIYLFLQFYKKNYYQP